MTFALSEGQELTIPEVIQEIENGLPVSAFNDIRDELQLSDVQLSQIIRVCLVIWTWQERGSRRKRMD